MEQEEEIKLILLGESGVGKTSIIKRYLYDKFGDKYEPNIAVNYVEKDIKINNKKIKLNIWDTIGQEKYRAVSKLFLNEAQIVILVYSITDSQSFKELNYWNNLYKEQMGEKVVLGVVGNKIDLFTEQKVTENEGKQYAEECNANFTQLSAKENKLGIDEYIQQLIIKYLELKNSLSPEDFEIIENREKGIILSHQQLKDLGYKEEGCCGGKAKKRRKRYEEILKNNKGYLDCIFLGANGVGKTSLIKAIVEKEFDPNEKHTEELTQYETKYTNKNMQIVLNIYDINNDEMKKKSTEMAIRKSKIFFLIYDLSDMRSYSEIKFWIKVIGNCREENDKKKDDRIISIIANKNDLVNDENEININNFEILDNVTKGENLANEINAIFYSTSAKNDKKIKDILGIAIEKYLNYP